MSLSAKIFTGLGLGILAGLFVGEPLAALDPGLKGDILPYIERMRDEEGIPIVYVTHTIEEIVRLADTLVLMSEGKVAAVGPVVDRVLEMSGLRTLFGIHPTVEEALRS